MPEIHASVLFRSAPEVVFAAISDHVTFFASPRMACLLLRPGDVQSNGLGAVREVRSGSFIFVEDITRFEPPLGFDYHVCSLRHATGLKAPFRHQRGWLELTPAGSGTRVDWRSRFSIDFPLFGRLLERRFARVAERGFEKLLLSARNRLEPGPAAT